MYIVNEKGVDFMQTWKKILIVVGAAIASIGSLGLVLRAYIKKHVVIKQLARIKTLYEHVKVIVSFELLENPNDKTDMTDMLNAMFYEKHNLIIVKHYITRELLQETIEEYDEDNNYDFDNMTDDEIMTLMPGYICEDADIQEHIIADNPPVYTVIPHIDIKLIGEDGKEDDIDQ